MAGKRTRTRSTSNMSAQMAPPATVTAPSTEQLQSFSKEQLKSECRRRGQKTSGNKTELVQRLCHKMPNTSTKRKDGIPEANGNNKIDTSGADAKHKESLERDELVLWRKPIVTTEYFVRELFMLLYTYGKKVLAHRTALWSTLAVIATLLTAAQLPGPQQMWLSKSYQQMAWCLYWVGLGVLSSVGLGTGLHTFLLYLGPHIARVTIAAYECGGVDFPEPPYPDDIICQSIASTAPLTIFTIMSKVRLEAMCWGAGTALGELPPYFMARAARLSGNEAAAENEELKDIEQLQRKARMNAKLTFIERGKLTVEKMVEKVGFLGILACASIPNPLFDLAGITCGHFLVPFWTFFGATLIGKAIIKMHIQKLFVIIAFNETLIEKAIVWLTMVPVIGTKLQEPFKEFLVNQKNRLHRTGGSSSSEGGSMLAWVFEKFVIAMILYFVVSIVNSLAQNYHKRIHKNKKVPFNKKATD